VFAVDIALHWRWILMVALATSVLAEHVLPGRSSAWGPGVVWLTSATAVLACEMALLLHELSHAIVARGGGLAVERIVFHGFVAETILRAGPTRRHEAAIALAGPAVNLGVAATAQAARLAWTPGGPVETVLVLLVIGNMAAAAISLLPLGASDGARALRALRATSPDCQSAPGRE
jgi:Zn-dependent protease